MGRRYGIPTTLLALGVLSMAMLIWTEQISQRQRMHFALANALMDLRIRAATSHLWLEEAISGEAEAEMERAEADLREATRLSEVILDGGESEYGLILQPLEDPELRRRAEHIRWLLSEFTTLFHERRKAPETAGAGSVLENRNDEIFDELQRRAEDLETIVEKAQATDYASSRSLFLGMLLAWSSILAASAMGLLVLERKRIHAEEALQRARDELETRVAERTTQLGGLTQQLVRELCERQKTEESLKESQEQLRHLSASLLTAQEAERSRIAAELHDELGHALVLLKLRLGLVKKELREDQSAAKEACEHLLQLIDQIIEEVRRLSRDLSPSVLEDLGLSAALRWLADNSVSDHETRVVSSIADIDHLFSRNHQILIYRIVQEALTNAGKHAQAKCVRLDVHGGQADPVTFVVEDDGKGFEVNEVVMLDASARGLGLATMDERARMLGGVIRVWSEKGKGTRITLAVPVRKGEGGHDAVRDSPCR